MAEGTRRPIRARDTKWAHAAARRLAGLGLSPNQISIASGLFAACAGATFIVAGMTPLPALRAAMFVLAASGIQLRLLCNLFDGMVAVEGGRGTKSGEIYNELPDRFADLFILAGAGYSFSDLAWMPALGWSAAALAVTTAYVRALGAAAGAGQHFLGPMAKQHRMAVMTAAALVCALNGWLPIGRTAMAVALGLVNVGCVATIVRRTRRIIRELESK
jgi:phosphatidylglycerophosphate synthase